jgi:hypothetical protein
VASLTCGSGCERTLSPLWQGIPGIALLTGISAVPLLDRGHEASSQRFMAGPVYFFEKLKCATVFSLTL